MKPDLLRGRWLYVILGALIVLLFVWSRAVLHHAAVDAVPESQTAALEPSPAAAEQTLRWLPDRLELRELPRALAQQPFLGAALAVTMAGTLGFALLGFGLSLWGLWAADHRALWRFPAAPLPAWSFGELGRIMVLTVAVAMCLPLLALAGAATGLQAVLFDAHLRLTVSMLLLDAAAILIIAAFAVGKSTSLWRTFGCTRRGLMPALATGVRGYVTMFPWLFIVLWLVVEAARAFGLEPPIEPIQELVFQEDRPAVLALTALLACVVGPLAEELFFRGVVWASLRRRVSRAAAMGLSAAAFAALHGNPVGFPSIWLLGCLLAYLYERTGSLAAPLAVHVLHNTLLMSTALMLRRVMELAG